LPQFQLRWYSTDEEKDKAKALLKREMNQIRLSSSNNSTGELSDKQSADDTDEDFFSLAP
jgi:DNA polymerase III sliding clamp (beta) subunit (PCNA family)